MRKPAECGRGTPDNHAERDCKAPVTPISIPGNRERRQGVKQCERQTGYQAELAVREIQF
ncbi:hypothetical protein GCM10009076_15520 [Erythrobacter ramosus]